jgi:hypothetical protein
MMVLASAQPERRAEFEHWYDDHLRRMRELDHVVACRRFERIDGRGDACEHEFVTIYELADDLEQAIGALATARASMPAAVGFVGPPTVWFFGACDEGAASEGSAP